MPAVRKIKIPLADLFWLPFFSKGIQSTLGQIRKSVTERNTLLSYCECVCFNWGSPIQASLIKGSYRPPQTWKEFFGDGEDTEVWATNRGDLRKPPHGTPAGFALHFDDCPVLVSKLLMQITGFDYGKADSLKDRLLLWHNYDPGAETRFILWHEDLLAKRRAKTLRQPLVLKRTLKEIKKLHPDNWPGIVASIENRTSISRAKLKAEKPRVFTEKELQAAERHHAEWHEIAKMMDTTPSPSYYNEPPATLGAFNLTIPNKSNPAPPPARKKGELSKAAHDIIEAREKVLKNWPSISDFVSPELLSTRIEAKKSR